MRKLTKIERSTIDRFISPLWDELAFLKDIGAPENDIRSTERKLESYKPLLTSLGMNIYGVGENEQRQGDWKDKISLPRQ